MFREDVEDKSQVLQELKDEDRKMRELGFPLAPDVQSGVLSSDEYDRLFQDMRELALLRTRQLSDEVRSVWRVVFRVGARSLADRVRA